MPTDQPENYEQGQANEEGRRKLMKAKAKKKGRAYPPQIWRMP